MYHVAADKAGATGYEYRHCRVTFPPLRCDDRCCPHLQQRDRTVVVQ
jgi:hypothetical protein